MRQSRRRRPPGTAAERVWFSSSLLIYFHERRFFLIVSEIRAVVPPLKHFHALGTRQYVIEAPDPGRRTHPVRQAGFNLNRAFDPSGEIDRIIVTESLFPVRPPAANPSGGYAAQLAEPGDLQFTPRGFRGQRRHRRRLKRPLAAAGNRQVAPVPWRTARLSNRAESCT